MPGTKEMTKRIPLEIKSMSVKSIGEEGAKKEFFTFTGYASVFDVEDSDNDIILKGAFSDTLDAVQKGEHAVKIFWQHDPHQPIGMPTVMREDEKGLYVEGALPMSDTFVTGRVIPQMEVGSVSAMSIGFQIRDYKLRGDDRMAGLEIRGLWLYEFSLVSLPANRHAQVSSFKSVVPFKDLPLADRARRWDSAAAVQRVRTHTGSEDAPASGYKNAFLWYDSENSENYGAYKLPIADVIDGELKAVPRAIFAAAAVMAGARGGVDVPEGDRPAIIRHINRYYDKMGLDSPFEKSFRLDDLDVTERTLEKLLTSGVKVCKKDAQKIISALKAARRDADNSLTRDADGSDDIGLERVVDALKKLSDTLKTK